MKKHSDDIFDKVNEGSFRLDSENQSFRLTGFRWRDAPKLLLGLTSSLMLLTGLNLAFASVFNKNLLPDNDRLDLHQEFQLVQELVANSEALGEAIRKDDRDTIERCMQKIKEFNERQEQRPAREGQRMAEHAKAEKALRKRYGAAAAGLIVAGLSLAIVSRKLGERRLSKLAEPTDAMDSR